MQNGKTLPPGRARGSFCGKGVGAYSFTDTASLRITAPHKWEMMVHVFGF